MPKIQIQKSTSLTAKDAFDKVQSFIKDDPDLRKLDSGYKCDFDNSKLCGNAKGKQFEAEFRVVDAAGGSQFEITVTLPFLLTPVKGAIEGSLKKKIDRLLA